MESIRSMIKHDGRRSFHFDGHFKKISPRRIWWDKANQRWMMRNEYGKTSIIPFSSEFRHPDADMKIYGQLDTKMKNSGIPDDVRQKVIQAYYANPSRTRERLKNEFNIEYMEDHGPLEQKINLHGEKDMRAEQQNDEDKTVRNTE